MHWEWQQNQVQRMATTSPPLPPLVYQGDEWPWPPQQAQWWGAGGGKRWQQRLETLTHLEPQVLWYVHFFYFFFFEYFTNFFTDWLWMTTVTTQMILKPLVSFFSLSISLTNTYIFTVASTMPPSPLPHHCHSLKAPANHTTMMKGGCFFFKLLILVSIY